ncbi:MAG: InlB B-repeat-containing protein, partial [Catonella sp.]
CLIAFAVVFTQIKVEAFADIVASVEYYDRDEGEIKTVSAEAVGDTVTTWGDGSSTNSKWYVVKEAVTINERITVTGNVHLILADNAILTAKKGIDVSAGNSLTIYAQTDMLTESTGKIVAEPKDDNAGIGGNKNKDGGTITITGGDVKANSRFGAGIGGGKGGAGGSIKITGGKVRANSENSGAGIGGGSYAAGGNIEITGGDVAAWSLFSGAGIGGGRGGDGGSIKIAGGKVIAKSSPGGGAGIGAGEGGTPGSFRTGSDGKAIIKTNNGISDTSAEADWKGIIFQDNQGKVYGEQELSYDFNVGGGHTLEIPSGGKLTIPQGKTLELNHGTKLENKGTLENNGKIKKRKGSEISGGDITGSGELIDKPYSTPTAVIDYRAEKLTGLSSDISYLITFDYEREDIDKPAEGKIDIKEQWLSKTLSIMAKEDDSFLESENQSLPIPTRPAKPIVNGVDEANYGKNDGKITGTTDKMEYTPSSSKDWKPCTESKTEGIAPGKYLVRIAPSENSFASEAAEVAIKKIHLITVENIGGGTANANKKEAYKDTEIMLTPTPDRGNYFKEWQAVSPSDLQISIDNKFTMPDGDVTVKAVFEKKTTPELTVSLTDWTFGESANTPTVTGNTGGGVVTYEYFTDETCTVKTTNADNGAASDGKVPAYAGKYWVKADIAETETQNAASAKAGFEIKKANQAAFSINSITDKKYGDDEFTLITTGGSGEGAVTFTVPANNGVLSLNGSTARIIGAGEVTVKAVKAGDNNYNEISAELKITIAKAATPALIFPNAGNLTYGQKLSESVLTGGSTGYGTFAWKEGNIIPTVNNAGYEVVFSPSEKTLKNYEAITEENRKKNVPVTVAKANPTVNLTANISVELGNKVVTLVAEITGANGADKPSGNVKFSYKDEGIFKPLDTVALVEGKASYKWENAGEKEYEIKAEYVGDTNYNAESAVKNIDTKKQSQAPLLFASIPDKTYGEADFILSATGGSGDGKITYSVPANNGVLKVKKDKATIIGAGKVTVTAKKEGNATYNEAERSVTVTVNKRKITVKADDKQAVKGGNRPEFTYNKKEVDKSLANGDTFTNPVLASTAANTDHTGEYEITVSGGELKNKGGADVANNYMVTYEKGILKIVDAVYEVTIVDGTGSGKYSEGEKVNITANDRSGYTFTNWTGSDGVVFTNASSKTTSFTMPAKAVTVRANYSANGGGYSGGSSGGTTSGGTTSGGTASGETTSGGTTSGGTSPKEENKVSKDDKNKTADSDKTSVPAKAEISIEAKKGKNTTATAKISEKVVENAITKALEEAKKNGKKAEKIALEVKVDMPKGTNKVKVNLAGNALERIVNEEVSSLTIDSPISKTVFDKKAVSEIKKKSKGGIVLSISPVKKLSKQAKKQIGKRPVLAISLSYLKGKKKITSLGKGKITAFIPYTLNKNEKADGLYAVYVDKKGKVRKIKGSYYDGENSAVVFTAGRLADFGIGYKKESK